MENFENGATINSKVKLSPKFTAPESSRSSSSRSTSNFDSQSSHRSPRRRRRHRRRRHSVSRLKKLEKVVKDLATSVSALHARNRENSELRESDADVLSLFAPDDLVDNSDQQIDLPCSNLNFKQETTLKSSGAKTSDAHAEMLLKLQHFDNDDWCQVRFTEAQKRYLSSPGFIELESNDMLKRFERNKSLAATEKTLAALCHGLIIQNEHLQQGFLNLVSWMESHQQITANLDLLQIVCGCRADIIQQRRDSLLHYVKDKYVKECLWKIPPTLENLFDDKRFSECVTKNGGVDKVFMQSTNVPPGSLSSKKALAQRASQGRSRKPFDSSHSRVHVTSGPSTSTATFAPPVQGKKRRAEPFRSKGDKYYKNQQGKRSQRRND
ncbi:unnamed protein product [Chilo suppressalis]|uniref:Uncharacterized protein n=1 Tax=Chilo suppressalis TaxID=168631 RepID=A0ABN8BAA1_CHISP|nr:unnamed protein product [Chilo suppressalis]